MASTIVPHTGPSRFASLFAPMERIRIENSDAVLRLNREEIRFLHQSLNEVLHGVGFTDGELSARLGAKREELEALIRGLRQTLDEIPE